MPLSSGICLTSESHRNTKFPDIEAELKDWLRERREMNAAVSDIAIHMRLKEIAKGISEDKFKLSAGWVKACIWFAYCSFLCI